MRLIVKIVVLISPSRGVPSFQAGFNLLVMRMRMLIGAHGWVSVGIDVGSGVAGSVVCWCDSSLDSMSVSSN